MKALLLLLAFSSISSAQAITGQDVLAIFTPVCSSQTFTELHQSFETHHLMDKELKTQKLKTTVNGAESANGHLAVELKDKQYTLKIGGKTFAGSDPCEVILTAAMSAPKKNAFVKLFVQDAFAQMLITQEEIDGHPDLVHEPSTTGDYLASSAMIFGGALMASGHGWKGLGGAAGGLSVLAGDVNLVAAKRVGDLRAKFQKLANSDFKLSCGGGWVKMIGTNATLNYYPAANKRYMFGYVEGGQVSNSDPALTPATAKFFASLATTCRTNADAAKLVHDLKESAFRQNVEDLVKRGSTQSIQGAETAKSMFQVQ